MDVASLHFLPSIPTQEQATTPTQRRWELVIGLGLPSSMNGTISRERATYDIDVLVPADNALPRHNIKVTFVHDPEIGRLDFTPFDAALFPWWAFKRQRASKQEGVA